jgi:hypothetical protein
VSEAVEAAGGDNGLVLQLFGLVGGVEAGFSLVSEGADDHPAGDEAEASKDSAGAFKVTASSAGVGDEDLGVGAYGGTNGRVLGEGAEGLFDGGGVVAFPLFPEVAEPEVGDGTIGVRFGAIAREVWEACLEWAGDGVKEGKEQ